MTDLSDRLRLLLRDGRSMTYPDIVHEFECTDRHARRAIQKLRDAGEVVADVDGKRSAWKLAACAERSPIDITASQALSLYTWRGLFDQLAGTHFADDIAALCAELQRSFHTNAQATLRRLDRKFYERVESRIEPSELRIDLRPLVTALFEEERVDAVHHSVGHGEKPFVLEPLTLVVFKRMLYVVGRTDYHVKIRTLVLTGFTRADRREGDRFDYPDNYRPEKLVETSFGIWTEAEMDRVRVRFTKKAAKSVSRKRWHPSQQLQKLKDGRLEMVVEVAGTTEFESWILGFGGEAEVLEPAVLRDRIASQLASALKLYKQEPKP